MNVITTKDFDINKLSFSYNKTKPGKMKIVSVKYDNQDLYLQTPEMYSPFDISDFRGNENYRLTLSFMDMKNRECLKHFHANLKLIEESLVEYMSMKSVEIFGKQKSAKTLKELVCSCLVENKNKDYEDSLRLKVPYKNDVFNIEIYDNKKELVRYDETSIKSSNITAIFRIGFVWVVNGTFGLSCNVEQLKVCPGKKVEEIKNKVPMFVD